MCDSNCISFIDSHLSGDEVFNKSILEIGSLNVNGTCRHSLMAKNPLSYIGIDLQEGDCVDRVLDVSRIVDEYGKQSFDVVFSCETLEHVENWKQAVHNIKQVLVSGGLLLITTRSGGGYHGHPDDFWRFSYVDFIEIFSDFEIHSIEADILHTGIFIKCKKPVDWKEVDLTNYSVLQIKK